MRHRILVDKRTKPAAGPERRAPRRSGLRCAALVLACTAIAGIAAGEEQPRRLDFEVATAAVGLPTCEPFLLPVTQVVPAPAQYRDFCERHPGECDMSGASVMQLSIGAWRTLNEINRAVNAEISFVPDPEEYGFEDYWTLPSGGYGDCEDFALEKRRRLVEAGLPRAAMRMAIVQHQLRFFSHAVLTVNTTRGGLVLDDLGEGLICWNDAPFNYEMRENLDGSWSRFDQTEWPFLPLPQLHRNDQTVTRP